MLICAGEFQHASAAMASTQRGPRSGLDYALTAETEEDGLTRYWPVREKFKRGSVALLEIAGDARRD